MKVTAGAHPDVPHPWTNGPEGPPEPIRGRDKPLRLASERYEQGVSQLAALINHWLGRSDFSHEQLCSIANWSLGEVSTLIPSSISRIRNGLQVRGAGFKHLDALAAANYAIWLWQTEGQEEAWAQLGPHTSWRIASDTLDRAIWLPRPDKSVPLDYADFAYLLAGYMELPYLGTPALSPGETRKASDALVLLLDRLIRDRGWGAGEGIRNLLEAYPPDDKARQRRLKRLILGETSLSREELEVELHSVAEMIRQVRGLKPGSYGPAELQVELLSGLP